MTIPLVPVPESVPLRGTNAEPAFRANVVEFLDAIPPFSAGVNATATAMNATAAEIGDRVGQAEASAQYAQEIYDLFAAENLPALTGTSSSTVLLGLGTKTFPAVSTGKAWWEGLNVTARDASNPARFVVGPITAYDDVAGTLTMEALNFKGSGSPTSWTITPGGQRDLTETRKTYEAIGPAVSTAGGSAWTFTNIPQVYSDLHFRVEALAFASGTSLIDIETSTDNGATWGAAIRTGRSSTDYFYCSGDIAINHYRSTQAVVFPLLAPNSSPGAAAPVAGPINAVRIKIVGGGTTTGGSIQLYGI